MGNEPIRFDGHVEVRENVFIYFSCEATQVEGKRNCKCKPDMKELQSNAERTFRSWFENKPTWTETRYNPDTPPVQIPLGSATYVLQIRPVDKKRQH